MLSKIVKPGDRIEITKPVSEEKMKELIKENSIFAKPLISQVYDIIDETQLKIAMPIVAGRVTPLPLNARFDICFFTNGGLYKSGFSVIDRYKENGLYVLVIELIYELKKYQRRQYYRLECLMEINYVVTSEEMEAKLQDEDYLKELFENSEEKRHGIVMDISGGGVRFASKEKLEPNSIIVIKLDIHTMNNKEVYAVLGRIVNSTKMMNKDGMYDQRVEYFEIEGETRENIIRYIFEQERKMRQK